LTFAKHDSLPNLHIIETISILDGIAEREASKAQTEAITTIKTICDNFHMED